MTKVKICGITNVADALFTARLGADYLGLVFAVSKRQIDLEEALEIKRLLPQAKLVAVFKNQHPKEVETIVRVLKPYAIQVYDDLNYNLEGGIKIIRSGTPDSIPSSPETHMLLIDSKHPGSGQAFDWTKEISSDLPLFIAGGLNLTNLSECIRIFRPYAVDVSSGVETHGKKDQKKIAAFIKSVKKGGPLNEV
ncbi:MULTISPECIES: phosphoribosylanthranilate isomerase [unclassified Fusibacter]|uniref:phosphoribosylanthranilate isomerase n=1 Tax=unclassified Fusibacter TaxID=2624464 RepID=UPI0010117D6F|nr:MULTISPECIES: phosphoribosylanthranilate isomerase [unclassified Fusibacter]MCK8061418.1 phosphoribosylanthranilate isomerase [Fusibacter sp. A2]NPE23539.1 phosphoribosylanthranilate isomerase [Fusibacter sp. A1]RXV58950.1 phosphoribosylanthranilate isomerase [Fusibacter sp. A1]